MNDLYPLIEEALSQGKEVSINGVGRSMEPFLYNGDKVILKRDEIYKKNDIIFYRRKDGQFILHRIYKKKKDGFVLLGDHQCNKEYGVTNDMIIGKVIRCFSLGKEKKMSGFKYHLYLFFWQILILRKVILFIKRKLESSK